MNLVFEQNKVDSEKIIIIKESLYKKLIKIESKEEFLKLLTEADRGSQGAGLKNQK